MANQYALMIWKHDKPITGNILKLENIVSPRKALEDYRVGDVVTARLRGFGTPEGVIGKIGGDAEKKEMQNILAGEGFAELLKDLDIAGFNHQEQTGAAGSQDNAQGGESVTQKSKRKNDTTPAAKSVPKPKKKKQLQTLDLEKAGENLELMEIEMQMSQEQMNVCQEQQPNVEPESVERHTSSILLESFNVLNNEQQIGCSCEISIERLSRENQELRRKIENVENENNSLWAALNQVKENITWLYYNKQQMDVSSSAFTYNEPISSLASIPRPTAYANATACSSDFEFSHSSQNVEPDTNTTSDKMPVETQEITSGPSHQDKQSDVRPHNYTKEQLSSMISHMPDFCKAAKFLFRRLYKEEEYVGRSITGNQANSKAQRKPAIEDKTKLSLIYDAIQQKWPFVTAAMVNGKIAEVLKPSRNQSKSGI